MHKGELAEGRQQYSKGTSQGRRPKWKRRGVYPKEEPRMETKGMMGGVDGL